jgi:Domain of unknown function (DUF4032)
MAELTVRAGHPDFLDLPWDDSIVDWDVPHMVDLPKGISRHQVRFFEYPQGIYVVKELSLRAARQDYSVLRSLESFGASAVTPVGVVEQRHPDPHAEQSSALITVYEPFSFSYREMLEGPGFGARRTQMLNAFAGLLVELHLAGVFWGDCSLSNVLYRFDAEGIVTIMVDAETAEVFSGGALGPGRREEDLEIMILNVAGGMSDIAAANGLDIDEADLALGEDIAERYRALWSEVSVESVIGNDERYRIDERIRRINELGFDVEEVDLIPVSGGSRLKLTLRVRGRNFHANRLKELTGVDALENQARQILTDLHHYQAMEGATTATGKSISAIKWRTARFEPFMTSVATIPEVADPVQAFCDVLHLRYMMSASAGRDVGTDAAYEAWVESGRPGYPLED